MIDYNKRVCGEKSPKRNKLDLQKDDKLNNILELLKNGQINIEEFVDSASFLINFKNSFLYYKYL